MKDCELSSKEILRRKNIATNTRNMICNVLLPSRGITTEGSSGSGDDGEAYAPTPGVGTGGAAGIMTGAASTDMKLGEGVVACSAATTASSAVVAPFNMQNLSIAYFPQRGTITLMGGSEAQAAMIEKFIKANDIKQP